MQNKYCVCKIFFNLLINDSFKLRPPLKCLIHIEKSCYNVTLHLKICISRGEGKKGKDGGKMGGKEGEEGEGKNEGGRWKKRGRRGGGGGEEGGILVSGWEGL